MKMMIPIERLEQKIYWIRGQRVMLDRDLAELYGVTTFNLNKAVSRNRRRFPEDFMFRLTAKESSTLKFQIGMSKPAGRGGRRTLPLVFTEQGVSMLSSVLRSERAVEVNIAIMRAFVRLRRILAEHGELASKLAELESHVGHHSQQIRSLFQAIRRLMSPRRRVPRIGFLRSHP